MQVVAFHPIDGRAPAGEIRAVQRRPDPVAETVNETALDRINRILLAPLAVEKIVVVLVGCHSAFRVDVAGDQKMTQIGMFE